MPDGNVSEGQSRPPPIHIAQLVGQASQLGGINVLVT